MNRIFPYRPVRAATLAIALAFAPALATPVFLAPMPA